jgi:hypothetical protein
MNTFTRKALYAAIAGVAAVEMASTDRRSIFRRTALAKS